MIVEEENPGELASGVEVGPVDGGAAAGAARGKQEGLEGGVEGAEQGEVRGILRVAVPRVDGRRIHPAALLAQHVERRD